MPPLRKRMLVIRVSKLTYKQKTKYEAKNKSKKEVTNCSGRIIHFEFWLVNLEIKSKPQSKQIVKLSYLGRNTGLKK